MSECEKCATASVREGLSVLLLLRSGYCKELREQEANETKKKERERERVISQIFLVDTWKRNKNIEERSYYYHYYYNYLLGGI